LATPKLILAILLASAVPYVVPEKSFAEADADHHDEEQLDQEVWIHDERYLDCL